LALIVSTFADDQLGVRLRFHGGVPERLRVVVDRLAVAEIVRLVELQQVVVCLRVEIDCGAPATLDDERVAIERCLLPVSQ
jgi:hypothetical protein